MKHNEIRCMGNLDTKIAYFTEHDNGNAGETKTIDFNNSNFQRLTLNSASCSLTFTPLSETGVARFQLRVVQDATGGRNMLFPANTIFPNGTFYPTLGIANQHCILTLYWDGTNYIIIPTNYFSLP